MIHSDESVPVKQRILETVDQLFYRQGIRAVGVDTIVAELGISKKTLYRHFRSKGKLIEAYLSRRSKPLPVSDRPAAEQILASFERIERLSRGEEYRGCAFLNAIAELADEREARKIAVSYKESRRVWYRDLLSQLDVDDPETLATQLAMLVDGAYAAVLIGKDPALARPALAAARVLLKNAGVRIVRAEPEAGKKVETQSAIKQPVAPGRAAKKRKPKTRE